MLTSESIRLIEGLLKENSLDQNQFCFAAVGSIGRQEALAASDLDIIPIINSKNAFRAYKTVDQNFRKKLSGQLGIKVSRGKELTQPVLLSELSSPSSIGGENDSRVLLTQRILVLTESSQAGGKLPLNGVRKKIISGYTTEERSSGRHPLAFCNDVARYYRQVCIDYKFKVDTEEMDWCTRNVKLRHSRKFWYFATFLSLAAITRKVRPDHPKFVEHIVGVLELPPILRLIGAVPTENRNSVGRALDLYAWFLQFMSSRNRRGALSRVSFKKRNDHRVENPYPAMQSNSKLMHIDMLRILEGMEPEIRNRVLDWFLL